MAFGFGPGAELQKDYNRNNSLVKNRKSLKEINNIYKKKTGIEGTDENQMGESDFREFKEKLRKEKKVRDIKMLVVFLLLTIILGTFSFLLLN